MKKKRSKAKILLMLLAASVLGWAAWQMLLGYEVVRFNPEQTGVVDVIVTDHHGTDDTLHYYNIGRGRVKQECEPFEPDDVTAYTVDWRGLESYIDQEKGKVLNRLHYIHIQDDQGNAIVPTPLMEAVVTQAATLQHDIIGLHIFQVGEETFLQTELNVNLWCPVELYWYNPDTGKLVELYTFDGLEIVGMHICNLDLVR